MRFDISGRMTKAKLNDFAEELKQLSSQIGFNLSSRGWCYQLETEGIITKAEFDKVENIINNCRRQGILPIDFVAEEESRQFSGVEEPNTNTPIEDMREWIEAAMESERYYTPDWWDGEKYYIQMVVEKIDLKTLFRPVCKKYHIPIATSKGWSSMLMRAIYARRFKEAEEKGLQPVLLYCGDHDPDGLRISDFLRKNLRDLKDIEWEDGEEGYDPKDLKIDRFGIDYPFIEEHNLTWIDNLITGSGQDLANPSHKNHKMAYVQNYISNPDDLGSPFIQGGFGVRKCEANAIVPMPKIAEEIVETAITKFTGKAAVKRFEAKRQKIKDEVRAFRDKVGLSEALREALDLIDEESREV